MSSCCTTGHQWQVMSALRSLITRAQGLIHLPKFPGRDAWTDGHEKTTGTFYDVCIRQPGTTSQQCRTVCLTSSLRWRYPAHASHGRATKPVRACDPLHTRPDGGPERWSPACDNQRAVTAGLLDCLNRSIVDAGRARRQSPHAHAKVLWDPTPPRDGTWPNLPLSTSDAARSSIRRWERSLLPTDPPPIHHQPALTRSTANQCRLYAFSIDLAGANGSRGGWPFLISSRQLDPTFGGCPK
jgi:hypothetical protein